jgi:hypothetical protein
MEHRDGEIVEPDNSTVDDWMGQEVNRDQELAEQVLEEAGGDLDKAEKLFEERSAGNQPDAVEHLPTDQRNI